MGPEPHYLEQVLASGLEPLSLSPFERLRASSRAAKALTGWRCHAAPEDP
jgi:hypothetical protein